jgi:hypothetical protein
MYIRVTSTPVVIRYPIGRYSTREEKALKPEFMVYAYNLSATLYNKAIPEQ